MIENSGSVCKSIESDFKSLQEKEEIFLHKSFSVNFECHDFVVNESGVKC